jgi:hypothetical protein
MTSSIQVEARNASTGVSYRVERRDGCVLVFGGIPVSGIAALTKTVGRGAVLDTDLARLAGASMAFGSRADVEALKASLAPSAAASVRSRYSDLDPAAAEWLATGKHGTSAATIFYRLTGVRPNILRDGEDPVSHPRDPDDLRRCRLLLEQVPAFRLRLDEMRAVSPHWAALVGAWGDLCATMDAECPQWRDGHGVARETYSKMVALNAWAPPENTGDSHG